jgi:hypothetical protein
MSDYDDLDEYNGEPEHDMWVDYDYNANTGELPDEFDDEDLDEFIDNLNDGIETNRFRPQYKTQRTTD